MASYDLLMSELAKARSVLTADAVKAAIRRHYPDAADRFLIEGARQALDKWLASDGAAQQQARAAAEPALTRQQIMNRASAKARYDKRSAARDVEYAAMRAKGSARIVEICRKVEVHDRIVDLLDSWDVGGTRLGDCTQAKLTVEAAKLAGVAADATKRAQTYRKIAAVLKPGETVRQSDDRHNILDIIRGLVS